MSISLDQQKDQNYDVCVVFPGENGQFKPECLEVVSKIIVMFHKENISMFKSVMKDEIFVLIHIPLDKLKGFADSFDLTFIANPVELQKRATKGWPDRNIKPLKVDVDNEKIKKHGITKFDTFNFIYLVYEANDEFQDLYLNDEHHGSPFGDRHRINIIHRMLDDQMEVGGLELKLRKLTKEGIIKAAYPLHNPNKLQFIKRAWLSYKHLLPWDQPLYLIRDYFGEEITLYYGFLAHFSLMLLMPACVGLGTEVLVLISYNVNHPIVAFYSVFIVLWGVYFTEQWKRREKYIALKNGMLGFEDSEQYRSEFVEQDFLYIVGKKELYYSSTRRAGRLFFTFLVVFFMCACVIGTTAAIYIFKSYLYSHSKESAEMASIVSSVLTAASIQFWGFIYSFLSNTLTDYENHKTDTDYQDSMIAKNFAFSFINAYSSFFYIGKQIKLI